MLAGEKKKSCYVSVGGRVDGWVVDRACTCEGKQNDYVYEDVDNCYTVLVLVSVLLRREHLKHFIILVNNRMHNKYSLLNCK